MRRDEKKNNNINNNKFRITIALVVPRRRKTNTVIWTRWSYRDGNRTMNRPETDACAQVMVKTK